MHASLDICRHLHTHDHDDPNLATRTALATFILSDLNLNLPLVSTRSLSISISSPLSPPICTHIRTRITSNLLLLEKMLRRDVAACYRIAAVASMIVGGVVGGVAAGNADGATALDSLVKVNTA